MLDRSKSLDKTNSMVKKIIYMILIASIIGGCAYSVRASSYPHLKKIFVLPVQNKTSEYDITDEVQRAIPEKVRSDGRLKLVTLGADCQLECIVLDYQEKIYSYDSANQVQEYQANMLFSVQFTDLTTDQVLYENKNLLVSETWSTGVGNPTSRFKTKEEARNEIYRKLFETIIKNTLEAW